MQIDFYARSEKKFFEEAAPELWYTYAYELADIADAVFRNSKGQFVAYMHEDADGSITKARRPFVSRPVLLLYGLSLENLIKGLLISENPKLMQGGKLSKYLQVHNLVKLSRRLKSIQLDGSELQILELLSDVVPYHGRYPVPRGAESMKPEQYISESIYDACRALFKRLEMQLYKLNHQGIDAPEGVRFANLRLTHLDGEADFITEELDMDYDGFRREFDS
ncbi:hypothetical protein SAMN05444004_1089 [Jannaschia faecimaris]|uniref:Uncharacterized protein n=1 Tax=Jannaschia faecimaris TaxID=1244108 RepID=A0A1H3R8V5_9RHOB|nr:hypothetical protein [Jannaschia faecimaris]SDZ22097.1 hypothetical protein SAMN05444004_1089 [Jannaschia faecimaris]